jgi:aldose 1-epimerase
MTVDPALSTLVIFSPPERSFFCVEPVSHCIDAFNLAAKGMGDTGMRVLASGESWEATVHFTPAMA